MDNPPSDRQLWAAARKMSRRPHSAMLDADDFFGVAMAARAHAVETYDADRYASLNTYCWACIRSRLLDALRGDIGRSGHPSGDRVKRITDAPLEAMVADPGYSPWSLVDDLLDLANLLGALPARERTLLNRAAVEEVTHSALAAEIGVSESRVGQLVRRAQGRLRFEAQR